MQKQIELLYRPLFLYVRKRINNEMDAEDLTQEVFYKLAKYKSDKIENIKSWVYTIAKNTITDYYRKKKIITEDVEPVVIDDKHLDEETVAELSNCVAPFINQLPEDYRVIMKLSELEGVSQKEIAERLDMNYVTVRSKVQRGRVKLKELFADCCVVLQGGKGSILSYKRSGGCKEEC